jgi:hypothetical protein
MTTKFDDTRCVAVFTARSPNRIIKEGGSQAWALDPTRVRVLRFLVCVQNQNNPDRNFSDASEPHGRVFLVGKISDVVPSEDDHENPRWRICIDEYSTYADGTNAWQGWRNPVRYTTLEEMGINLDKLTFHSVSEAQKDFAKAAEESSRPVQTTDDGSCPAISIANAKLGLAAFYGVPPEAIEIIIRG